MEYNCTQFLLTHCKEQEDFKVYIRKTLALTSSLYVPQSSPHSMQYPHTNVFQAEIHRSAVGQNLDHIRQPPHCHHLPSGMEIAQGGQGHVFSRTESPSFNSFNNIS